MDDFYSKYKKDMILRDYLALDRTKLANERTLLAYMRTFIGFFASGLGLIKLFEQPAAIIIGYVFIACAPICLIYGIISFIKQKKRHQTLYERDEQDEQQVDKK